VSDTDLFLLSDRLRRIRRNGQSADYEELTLCIEQAEVMENAVWTQPTKRTSDPDTSEFVTTKKKRTKLHKSLMVVFLASPDEEPIDEVVMVDLYERCQIKYKWMVQLDMATQGSSPRKRRKDIERFGIVKRVDKLGVGVGGGSIGRYALTAAGREEAMNVWWEAMV
jgi:hypothetical protein